MRAPSARYYVAAFVGVALVAYLIFGAPLYLRLPSSTIENVLIRETPLGTSIDDVISSLKQSGLTPKGPFENSIRPGHYPKSYVHGEYWAVVLLGEYRVLFVTSVEAFYIFNGAGELVGVGVRKSVDAL